MDEKKRPGWDLAEDQVGQQMGEVVGQEKGRQVKMEICPHQPASTQSAFKQGCHMISSVKQIMTGTHRVYTKEHHAIDMHIWMLLGDLKPTAWPKRCEVKPYSMAKLLGGQALLHDQIAGSHTLLHSQTAGSS